MANSMLKAVYTHSQDLRNSTSPMWTKWVSNNIYRVIPIGVMLAAQLVITVAKGMAGFKPYRKAPMDV